MDQAAQKFIDQLFTDRPEIDLPVGTLLYQPGEEIDTITYVLSGTIKQSVLSPKGEEVIIALLKPPVLIPIVPLLADKLNQFYFETVDDKTLIKKGSMDHDLERLLGNRDVCLDLATRFAGATWGLALRVASLTTRQQKDQLFNLLDYLSQSENVSKNNGWRLTPEFTHAQLASWLGTARETVSRLLKQLEKEGKISYQAKRLWIKP